MRFSNLSAREAALLALASLPHVSAAPSRRNAPAASACDSEVVVLHHKVEHTTTIPCVAAATKSPQNAEDKIKQFEDALIALAPFLDKLEAKSADGVAAIIVDKTEVYQVSNPAHHAKLDKTGKDMNGKLDKRQHPGWLVGKFLPYLHIKPITRGNSILILTRSPPHQA